MSKAFSSQIELLGWLCFTQISKLLARGTKSDVSRVSDTSTEAFIIRCYRRQNRDGFLKAFTDSLDPFKSGFAPLARAMRNLFLDKTSLWPRFELSVKNCLEGPKKAEVINFEVQMSDSMTEIQHAVLQCVEGSIRQLKKSGTGLDFDDSIAGGILNPNFYRIVFGRLQPDWHKLSPRIKQIVRGLAILRQILE